MKILVVSNMFPDDINHSYGIFVKRFCNQLSLMGIEYETAVMLKGSSKLDKILKYILFYVSSFVKCLLGEYDVVYVHYASHSSLGVIFARKLRKFTIYTNLHGSDVVPENRNQVRMQKYTRAILAESKKIVVPSEYFKALVSEKYVIDKEKIYVYPSAGVDKTVFFERTLEEKRRLKEKFGLSVSHVAFGMAGRITKDKGWDDFVKAVDIVNKRGFNADFVIAGNGNQKDVMMQMIRENNLEDKIGILDLLPQEQLSEFYSAIDFFVFPTKRKGESLGLVALEAMACGTPVIASDFAAPHYYVIDGINGYKFEVGNADALADIVIKLIAENRVDDNLRVCAVETASRFCTDNVIDDLKIIVEGIE